MKTTIVTMFVLTCSVTLTLFGASLDFVPQNERNVQFESDKAGALAGPGEERFEDERTSERLREMFREKKKK